MKFIKFLFVFIIYSAGAQFTNYVPNRKLEKTVSKDYYNTEYIYIANISENPINLSFELLEDDLINGWSATVCTNTKCYSNLPSSGSFGQILPSEQAFLSINLAANETIGNGKLTFLITSVDQPSLKDTVTFIFNVTPDGSIQAKPWAQINFTNGVVTVLLDNPFLKGNLQLFDANGKPILDTELSSIISYPLRDQPAGIYIVFIRDENDRIIQKKIVNT
jgi:hypothetical protein